jgi:hypothetical protein
LRQSGDSLANFAAVAQQAADSLEPGEAQSQVAAELRAAAKTADLAYVLEDLARFATVLASAYARAMS